jgi:hypothetical protein
MDYLRRNTGATPELGGVGDEFRKEFDQEGN